MTGPVYLVTGASKGIGKAMTKLALTKFHGKVVAVARSKELLESLQVELTQENNNLGDNLEVVVGDVCDEHTSRRAVNVAIDKWGRLDVVIANAGILEPIASVSDSLVQGWKHLFDVNFFSVITLAQEALPHLRHSKGTLIMISSGAASKGYKGWGAYGASKAALNHLNATLAVEEPDVTTLAIRPGVVDTGMQELIREKGVDAMKEDHSKFMELHRQGKLLSAEEPAHVVVALGANPPKDLSGQYLSWDDEVLKSFRK
ncbi:uncharacterized protein BX664DRAFT_333018 [Halteromyces radiatus]|uniref:uncharacterized protein n=1 Tax=Halteromyces radiatus TaxID=101107 RepID=UPI00221FCF04|nr:uncharacterized protein BX664DRAFT_333018 [Halteromyces radiatus]KAI8089439.1 hypothetical protein BX664DRAFT_333018 [Halteromyces radiatus]